MEKEIETVLVEFKDLYQLLLAECRYGYSRNNHLMPWGAFDKVKSYIPKMYEVNPERAIQTLKQICEECISDEIAGHFYDGEEDENNNRQLSIDFVNWSLDYIHSKEKDIKYHYGNSVEQTTWRPYNYDFFLDNLKKDDIPKYNVYEVIESLPTDTKYVDLNKKLITEAPLSKKEYREFIYTLASNGTANPISYHLHRVDKSYFDAEKEKYIKLPFDFVYEFIEPTKKVYYIEHI